MLTHLYRLKLDKEFNQVFKNGQAYYSKFLGIKVAANSLGNYRYGLLVSSKIVKKAVDRNKLKRQIRSLIKNHSDLFKAGYDYVIIILPQIIDSNYLSLKQDFINNIKSLNLN